MKKASIMNMKSIAYYSGFSGLEIKHIEHGINIVEWLESHNKNYTREQYYKILDLAEILDKLKTEVK